MMCGGNFPPPFVAPIVRIQELVRPKFCSLHKLYTRAETAPMPCHAHCSPLCHLLPVLPVDPPALHHRCRHASSLPAGSSRPAGVPSPAEGADPLSAFRALLRRLKSALEVRHRCVLLRAAGDRWAFSVRYHVMQVPEFSVECESHYVTGCSQCGVLTRGHP